MSFIHLLITRFNLKKNDWKFTKSNNKVGDEIWLEERFELFDKYCFPSVYNQTNNNFYWLILMDVDTPKAFVKKMENYQFLFPNIKLLFLENIDCIVNSIKEYIDKNVFTPFLITSRVDNDDALGEDYIELVQKQFSNQKLEVIDFLDGCTMKIVGEKFIVGKKIHSFNPFVSLIEENKNPKTIFCFDHAKWKNTKQVKRIKNELVWLSVIHENNKVNEYDGFGMVPYELIKKFNIKLTASVIQKKSKLVLFLEIKNFLLSKLDLFYRDIKRQIRLFYITNINI